MGRGALSGEMAQAFSHFTFDQSYGELLVVDIQGVPSITPDGSTALHLTDPQAGLPAQS